MSAGFFLSRRGFPASSARRSLALAALLLLSASVIVAAGEPSYRDIYLTENRLCKACAWEWADARTVRLTNRAGNYILVKPQDILGIDRHPVFRKLTLHSLNGIGLPGPVIAPSAFENGEEFTCKYCNTDYTEYKY